MGDPKQQVSYSLEDRLQAHEFLLTFLLQELTLLDARISDRDDSTLLYTARKNLMMSELSAGAKEAGGLILKGPEIVWRDAVRRRKAFLRGEGSKEEMQ